MSWLSPLISPHVTCVPLLVTSLRARLSPGHQSRHLTPAPWDPGFPLDSTHVCCQWVFCDDQIFSIKIINIKMKSVYLDNCRKFYQVWVKAVTGILTANTWTDFAQSIYRYFWVTPICRMIVKCVKSILSAHYRQSLPVSTLLSSFHAKYQNIAKITKTIVSIPGLLKTKSDSQKI